VKVDVQACFDTIDQTKLLEILRELISEVLFLISLLDAVETSSSIQDLYMNQKYGQINVAGGRIKRTFVRKAWPEG
jgi:telomerase reverse transcriptase